MKKLGGLFIFLLLAAVALPSRTAEAAACSNVSSFGQVSIDLPPVKNLDNQALWVRMQAPDKDAYVYAELNDEECYKIGGHEQPVDQWSWQTFRTNGQLTPIRLPRTEPNRLKLYGAVEGVKVDRVMITEAGCTPDDFGNNCQTGTTATDSKDATVLPPPSDGNVHGLIVLSTTPKRHAAELAELSYAVNGKVLQTSTSVEPFDTTYVANGKYTVLIITKLKSGEEIRESTVISVSNPENAFTPLVRWARLNKPALVKYGGIAAAVIGLVILVKLLTVWRRHSRERSFHGF